MLKCLFLFCVAVPSLVLANNIDILKITNQEDRSVSMMFIEVDAQNNISAFGKKVFRNGILTERKKFPGDLSYSGIVLRRSKSKDLIILKSLNYDNKNGGSLEIDYLYNAISRERRVFVIELDRTSDSWQVSKSGRIIKKLHMVSNKVPLFGTVGIRRIEIK